MSHSRGHLLVAVARNCAVGIDIEMIRPEMNIEAIAERFFSSEETQQLRALTGLEKRQGFFSCWTEKGSVSKPGARASVKDSAGSQYLSFQESQRAFCLISAIRTLSPGQFVNSQPNRASLPPLPSKQPTLSSRNFNGMPFRVNNQWLCKSLYC